MKTPFFEKRGRLPWSMERCGSLSMFGDEYMGTQPFYLGLPFALKSKENDCHCAEGYFLHRNQCKVCIDAGT